MGNAISGMYPKPGQKWDIREDGTVKVTEMCDGREIVVDFVLRDDGGKEGCRMCNEPDRTSYWVIGFFLACDYCYRDYIAKVQTMIK